MLTFRWKYFALTVLLFLTEVLIAIFVNDNFVRPYFGDFLVVILIYCFMMSFWKLPVLQVALAVLLFSYLIEVLQYFKFVKLIGLQRSHIANVVLGNSFSWSDIIAYTAGIFFVILLEKKASSKRVNLI